MLRHVHLAQADALGGNHLALRDGDLLLRAHHRVRVLRAVVAVLLGPVVLHERVLLLGIEGRVRVELGCVAHERGVVGDHEVAVALLDPGERDERLVAAEEPRVDARVGRDVPVVEVELAELPELLALAVVGGAAAPGEEDFEGLGGHGLRGTRGSSPGTAGSVSTELIIIIAVVVVLLVLLALFLAARKKGAEKRRVQGEVEAKARRSEAGKLEDAAHTRRKTAEELRLEAEREREQAVAHQRRAEAVERDATQEEVAAHEAAERAKENLLKADKADPNR